LANVPQSAEKKALAPAGHGAQQLAHLGGEQGERRGVIRGGHAPQGYCSGILAPGVKVSALKHSC